VKKHPFCIDCGQCGDVKSSQKPDGLGIASLPGEVKGTAYISSINLHKYGVPEFIIPDVPSMFLTAAIDILRDLTQHVFGGPDDEEIQEICEGDTYVYDELVPLKFTSPNEEQLAYIKKHTNGKIPDLLIVSVDHDLFEREDTPAFGEHISASVEC
jgi:hypothetical protein